MTSDDGSAATALRRVGWLGPIAWASAHDQRVAASRHRRGTSRNAGELRICAGRLVVEADFAPAERVVTYAVSGYLSAPPTNMHGDGHSWLPTPNGAGAVLIPEFDRSIGHLPPGRHACTLDEVAADFVTSHEFDHSETRLNLFGGLVDYLAAWEELQEDLGSPDPFLRAVWIGGSFASAELNPNDVDISPLIDGPLASSYAGKPGSKRFRSLTRHRPTIQERYGVDVFPIEWFPVVHVLRESSWENAERAYLTDRGRFDDFWQRCRVDDSDVPSPESCVSRRGYLEVRL